MSFMAISVQKAGLRGHFVFASVHRHPRFFRVDTISRRNHVHHFRIARPEDIDATFVAWIAEAYRVGQQRHLRGATGPDPRRPRAPGIRRTWESGCSMRLWTIHPRYLDSVGLVALWREALLARTVLLRRTRGYRSHPQLERFRSQRDPVACINSYLEFVQTEGARRGYRFDRSKIGRTKTSGVLPETLGQLAYEWRHLIRKLEIRNPALARTWRSVPRPQANPLFRIVAGGVRSWERVSVDEA